MICTYCGHEAANLAVLDEATKVCYGCLDAFFTKCDICGEYWDESYVEFITTSDGRKICEYCREIINN